MANVSLQDVCQQFIDYVDLQLREAIADLHAVMNRQAYLIRYIIKHGEWLTKQGYDVRLLNYIKVGVIKNIDFNKLKKEDKLLYANVRSFNYLTDERIPYLKNRIKLYIKFRTINTNEYTLLLRLYNAELGNQLLKGVKVSLGKYLSTLEVIHVHCNILRKRNKVDFRESLKIKQSLVDRGIDLYSKDNPDGVKYLVYYNTNEYYWFKWTKRRVKNKNVKFYRFVPAHNINGPDIKIYRNRIPTEQELFTTPYAGIAHKLMVIQKHYPKYLNGCAEVDSRIIRQK